MPADLTLIATTAFGLEAVVKRELEALGYPATVISPGWVQFEGGWRAICEANLWLRCADRVLLRVARFPAPDFEALFETTKALPWRDWIPADAEFPVIGRSYKSKLTSVPACQRAVKRAVVDSLMAGHDVSTLPETGPQFKIQIALNEDQATLTLDTTGPSLHKRSYRQQAGEAPIKETLAAALVQLSFWNPERPLWDPFCGSGTIPIEAAMFGRNIAPGLLRSFAAENWPGLFGDDWGETRIAARDAMQPAFEERLIGTDVDSRSLDAARRNAAAVGVEEQVHFQQRSFDQLTSKRKYGCVVTNPPYGERLGDHRELEPLYQSIPEVLRKLPTWSHFILTAYPRFEKLVGRRADRRRKLYNGRINCTYYQFHGPQPRQRDSNAEEIAETVAAVVEGEVVEHESAAVADAAPATTIPQPTRPVRQQAAFGALTEKADEQAEIFANRLKKLARHLRRWPTRRGITCFRLYDRDIPEIPLVVDRYDDHLHITEYDRPHDRDPAQHANWLDLMVRAAAEALEVDHSKAFLKRRQRQRGTVQHEHLAEQHYEITVQEGGLKFLVNLSDYVDTGLFLDHRITRSMVREASAEKHVLNLFGYTGAFTVYAAAGGAARTTTVDWTRAYLDWARRNMQLNGFAGDEHKFVREDARAFLRGSPPRPQYDVAVVDPPTFSNSKRTEEDWTVQAGYVELLTETLRRMTPGGVIYFSTNFRQFKFDESALAAAQIREISKQTVPEDFRNKRIHRCWVITAP